MKDSSFPLLPCFSLDNINVDHPEVAASSLMRQRKLRQERGGLPPPDGAWRIDAKDIDMQKGSISRVSAAVWERGQGGGDSDATPDSLLFALKDVSLAREDIMTDISKVARVLSRIEASNYDKDGRLQVYLVRYYAFTMEDSRHYQYLMECCDCSLASVLSSADVAWRLTEKQCKRIVWQVTTALNHLHTVAGVVHIDVGPSNILLRSLHTSDQTARGGGVSCRVELSGGEWEVRLADMDNALPIGEVPVCFCGSLLYSPLEVLASDDNRDGATLAAHPSRDIWALGVLIYELLRGEQGSHPCVSSCARHNSSGLGFWDLLACLEEGCNGGDRVTRELLDESLSHFSASAREFVAACLRWDPEARPSAAELLRMPWLHHHS